MGLWTHYLLSPAACVSTASMSSAIARRSNAGLIWPMTVIPFWDRGADRNAVTCLFASRSSTRRVTFRCRRGIARAFVGAITVRWAAESIYGKKWIWDQPLTVDIVSRVEGGRWLRSRRWL